MKMHKYVGDYGINVVNGRPIAWVNGGIYTDLPLQNPIITRLINQNKLIELKIKTKTNKKKGLS